MLGCVAGVSLEMDGLEGGVLEVDPEDGRVEEGDRETEDRERVRGVLLVDMSWAEFKLGLSMSSGVDGDLVGIPELGRGVRSLLL